MTLKKLSKPQQLHQLHKRLKAGLIKPSQLTQEQEELLEKYYGYEREK